jgi:uncharacterized protein (TIGR02996 family)
MTTILTEGDALLADVVAHPERDDVRLILADWLQENGQEERAEFIRAQIELATWRDERDWHRKALTRERNLLTQVHFWEWFGDVDGWLKAWPGSPAVGVLTDGRGGTCEVGYYDGEDEKNWVFTVRRGFVAEVRLPQQAWLAHGREIAGRHPLERVELSDRKPALFVGAFCWNRGLPQSQGMPPDFLDPRLWYALPTRDTERATAEEAVADLSAACLLWAREG